MIRLLREFGADIETKDSMLNTPLLCAARQGQADAAELLLSYGASVDMKDKGGNSPLMAAVESGDERTLELLISAVKNSEVL